MNTDVLFASSTVSDGSMKGGEPEAAIQANRAKFLGKYEIAPEETVLVKLDYASDDFCRYDVVDESMRGEGMVRDGRIADGLATQSKHLPLFLPLADCIGALLYDAEHEAIMLTHLGRHNLEQDGARRSVEFMMQQFNSKAQNLQVWFSPSAGKSNYPLFAFSNQSLEEVAIGQLIGADVEPGNITISTIDTTTNQAYFSHSEFLKGNRQTDGRQAVVAMMN